MILFCHLKGDTVTVMVSRVGRLSEKPPSKISEFIKKHSCCEVLIKKVEMRQRKVRSPLDLMKRVLLTTLVYL